MLLIDSMNMKIFQKFWNQKFQKFQNFFVFGGKKEEEEEREERKRSLLFLSLTNEKGNARRRVQASK